jgi:hypothetical protein
MEGRTESKRRETEEERMQRQEGTEGPRDEIDMMQHKSLL